MVQHHAVNVCFGLVGPWILKRGCMADVSFKP